MYLKVWIKKSFLEVEKLVKEMEDFKNQVYVFLGQDYSHFEAKAISLLHKIKNSQFLFRKESGPIDTLKTLEKELRKYFHKITGKYLRQGTSARPPRKTIHF
ncbi:hypothetical protein [Paenibacillus planticolens]|uniref:Uncharacterized protein n=1 Tax=Paenibacillus planticolens TaxID=2654976 RepID=A0ABX1ZNX6_9BACL|nr:hypothetical protein [Paenibacillus planticolens]NOV01363.1 hypothetical protein [Paenibacillus planticolens]